MIGTKDKDLLDRLDRLASTGAADPASALQTLREVALTVGPLKERLTRPRAPTRLYTVNFGGQSLIVANTGITPIEGVVIKWPRAGRVIGVRAVCAQGLDLNTHLTLWLRDQDGVPFFSDGQSEAGITFSSLQTDPQNNAGYYPFLDRVVKPSEQWTCDINTLDPIPGGGSTTYTPEVVFLFDDT